MRQLFVAFQNDEAGFVISAELVLVATVAVLAMVVGLSEVAHGVNQELEDVGSAFGSVSQSFHYKGQKSCKAWSAGTCFFDQESDYCDGQNDIVPNQASGGESN